MAKQNEPNLYKPVSIVVNWSRQIGCLFVYISAYLSGCLHDCLLVWLSAYMCVYVCVCMHVCMPLCVSRSPLGCDGISSSRRSDFNNRLLIGMLTNGGVQA